MNLMIELGKLAKEFGSGGIQESLWSYLHFRHFRLEMVWVRTGGSRTGEWEAHDEAACLLPAPPLIPLSTSQMYFASLPSYF